MTQEEISPNNIKKDMIWNKSKTELMLQYEEETGKSVLKNGNKIKGDYEYWLYKKGYKTKGFSDKRNRESSDLELVKFASELIKIHNLIGVKISSRGWCYILEGKGIIDKSQFDAIQGKINKCRKIGLLPIDFVAVDKTRQFYNVEELEIEYIKPKEFIYEKLKPVKMLYQNKNDVSFWKFQKYYIQVMVEKIDLINLFGDICKACHIPIANAKGWSDLNSRNLLAQRFKKAEELGLQPVLLYYSDFDPAGLKIVETMRNNLRQIEKATKWNPENLIINRFGLTIDFIKLYNLTWIDNLITGSGRNLANPKHPDHNKPYVQDYIKKYGVRKCEANAILTIRKESQLHLASTIIEYLGKECFNEYKEELKKNRKEVKDMLRSVKFRKRLSEIIGNVIELM